jgi:hypothetical protein
VGATSETSSWDGVQEFPAARAFLCLTGFAALSFCLGWIPFKLGLNQLKTFEL